MRRQRFTLIELLVVIAIIAVLSSLLMPALSRARRKAKDMSCAGVQRQVAYAIIMFASDDDGRTPSIKASPQAPNLEGNDTYGGGWNGPGNVYWQGHAGRFRDLVRDKYMPVAMMSCPSNDSYKVDQLDNMTTHPFAGGITGQWVYWGTGFQFEPTDGAEFDYHFNRMANYRDSWPLLLDPIIDDAHPKSKGWPLGRTNHDPLGCRGGNITFIDGHGEWYDVWETKWTAFYNGTNNSVNQPLGPDGAVVPIISRNGTTGKLEYLRNTNGGKASAAQMRLYADGWPDGATN